MSLVFCLRLALLLLVPTSILSSSYLYYYPLFHQCAFPSSKKNPRSDYFDTLRQHLPSSFSSEKRPKAASFRLLALGDPQIEGDSSIGNVEAILFPNSKRFQNHLMKSRRILSLQTVRLCLHDLVDFYLDDIPKAIIVWWKRLDHFGNDYFLGHIYRTLHWWTNPTHIAVLGDLIGSQWVNDSEFERRGWRYWNRVFKGSIKVDEELISPFLNGSQHAMILGENQDLWSKRIINIAGNHDIGYAGDMSPARLERFARIFGKPNYELRFKIPVEKIKNLKVNKTTSTPSPELRIVVLNDMNLDVPAGSKELQEETYKFLNSIITTSYSVDRLAHFTLVLTHIPLFKKDGICVDGPFFEYFEGDYENGIKQQNLLSEYTSKGILEGIFGMSGRSDFPGQGLGRDGAILNGHDHEGCNVLHYINQSTSNEPLWEATTWGSELSANIVENAKMPSLREITIRSMMGAYDGNAGLMSLWFDQDTWRWKFELVNCKLGKQHIWWVIHIVDLITVIIFISYGIMILEEKFLRSPKSSSSSEAKSISKFEVVS